MDFGSALAASHIYYTHSSCLPRLEGFLQSNEPALALASGKISDLIRVIVPLVNSILSSYNPELPSQM